MNHNTYLNVDLKTVLLTDSSAKTGKGYPGVLRRDVFCEEFRYDEHFTFVETVPPVARKRNPHVYRGRYITVTLHDDGTYHPNFRPLPKGDDFNRGQYINGVANELLWALDGLVEKSE